MNQQPNLSLVTKSYLSRFYEILDNMMQSMDQAQLTDSISQNFIVQMIPHHEAAVQMAHNLLQYTTCIPLQNMALQIIEEQTKGIHELEAALESCSQPPSNPSDLTLYRRQYSHIAQRIFCAREQACISNQVDANFIREMIPHHRGSIQMAENALRFSPCPPLVPILRSIICTQQEGLRQMERLLCCL